MSTQTVKWDGHTHTNYCRHGSHAPIVDYLKRAIELGFERYSITEHPPLPVDWMDFRIAGRKVELAMSFDELDHYFREAKAYKKQFEGTLDIRIGLELDYLPGQESFTNQLVEKYAEHMDEAILSVHFLPGVGGMRFLDNTPDDFEVGLLQHYGTMEEIVDAYFEDVQTAIRMAGAFPLPMRIGHIGLIEKFRRALPPINPDQMNEHFESLLPLLLQYGVGVDVNTAGLRKETCGIAYVPHWFIDQCKARGIACVFGSDAHSPSDVGADWDWFAQAMRSPER